MKKIFQTLLLLFLTLCLWQCKNTHYTATTTGEYMLLDSTYKSQSIRLENLIKPYNDGLESQMNRILNTSDLAMTKARPEGILSNFVADLIFEEVNELDSISADFCLLNHGGLRSALPAGTITVGDIFQLMPFENEAVILELTGDKLIEIGKYLTNSGGEPISNATVNLTDSSILINDEPVNIHQTYKVVTSDYLANGGDKMTFFQNPVSYVKTGFKIRDLIIEHIEEEKREEKTLNSILDGRISKH